VRALFITRNHPGTTDMIRAVAARHEIVAVVESGMRHARAPSVPRALADHARGQKNVRALAARMRTRYLHVTRDNLNELEELVRKTEPDVGCVYGMAHLLPERIWRAPRHGFVNMHPSLLPDYRGPAPQLWQCLRNERETGISLHRIDEGEDTGDILFQATRPVGFGETWREWMLAYTALGARGFLEVLARLDEGESWGEDQRDLPCPFRARNPKKGEVLFDWDDTELDPLFHALRGTQPIWDHIGQAFPALPALYWDVVRAVEGADQRGVTRWTPLGLELGHPEGHILVRPQPRVGQLKRVARALRG